MSCKRRNTSSPEPDDYPASKRRHLSDGTGSRSSDSEQYGSQTYSQPKLDAVSGMFGAFPGLSGTEELYYGLAADGIDYLRMVRSEAKGVPLILTTDSTQNYGAWDGPEEENHKSNGFYYDDEAYTAKPHIPTQKGHALDQAQQRYHESLLIHFAAVRRTMKCRPPPEALQSLAHKYLKSFPSESRKARELWEAQLLTVEPHLVQMAYMDSDSISELLTFIRKRLSHLLRTEDRRKIVTIGTWIWAILGKCRDRGELGSEEIAELRALAERAASLSSGLASRNDPIQSAECGAEAPRDASSLEYSANLGESDAEQRSSRHASITRDPDILPSEATEAVGNAESQDWRSSAQGEKRIILEMIVVVVAAVYGQHDLLELLLPWYIEVEAD